MNERRPNLDDPAVLDALTHPVRLDVLGYLMSSGPATASACARAVGDTPSNCSYHLRVLASHGLVVEDVSTDGRTRPWRATITGFTSDASGSETDDSQQIGFDALAGASLQLDYQLAREHLRTHEGLSAEWRAVQTHASYGLRVTPEELASITERIDAIVRPYIAATRGDAPENASHAHLSMLAFPRPKFS